MNWSRQFNEQEVEVDTFWFRIFRYRTLQGVMATFFVKHCLLQTKLCSLQDTV